MAQLDKRVKARQELTMTIPVNELRHGVTFTDQDKLWQVLKYEHIKKGRGNATIKLRVKNMRDRTITERSYLSGQKVTEVVTTKNKAQYLYRDEESLYFMDCGTYDQFCLAKRVISIEAPYLKEGLEVELTAVEGEVLGITLPIKVKYRVVKSSPGVKGDSATNVYKEVELENGLKTKVPLFVNQGDEVFVDTRTGEYVERG